MDISQKVKEILPKISAVSVALAGHGTYSLSQGQYTLAVVEGIAASYFQIDKLLKIECEQLKDEIVTDCQGLNKQIPRTITAMENCTETINNCIGTIDRYLEPEYKSS